MDKNKTGSEEWAVATERVLAQLSPEHRAALTNDAIDNIVDMDPSGLAAGRSLLDVLVADAVDQMEELGVVAWRASPVV